MSTDTKDNPLIVRLKRVRLSFPNLHRPKGFAGDPNSKPAYSATFLLNKKAHAAEIAAIKKATEHAIKEEWKGKAPSGLKLCLRDGSEKADTDGYGDEVMFVAARNEKPVFVVDGKLQKLDEASGKPYAGCYVNAVIRLWAQDNKFGKRVNASLGNVQFVADGEAFGESARAPEDDFEEIEDESVV
jgi:hypothetical protein